MILHRYFARRFAQIFGMVLAAFFVLISLIALIEESRAYAGLEVSFAARMQLVLLRAPEGLSEILPLITILSTIILFLGFARSSELVVARAAGRSAIRALIAPIMVTLTIGIIAVLIFQPMAALANKYYSQRAESYRTGSASAVLVSDDGLWLRQGGTEGQTVIRAARANADASTLYDVTFLLYPPGSGPSQRIEAASATLQGASWIMHDVKIWPLDQGANPEFESQHHDTHALHSTLTLERIRETLGSPSGISIWKMPGFIKQLENAGLSARKHRVWFQAELARPLFLIAMVLIAASSTMRHTRGGGTGTAVLGAILVGFALYFLRSFAQILGENGQITPALAVWSVPAASIMLALGLLLHREDG